MRRLHRNAYAQIAQRLRPQFAAPDVVGGVVLLQGAALAAEVVEGVGQLGSRGGVGRVQDAAAVHRLHAVAQAQVFGRQREQEGHPAVAVRQDVEDVLNDAPAIRGDAEEEAAVAGDAEVVQRLQGQHAGRLLQAAQIPPEGAAGKGVTEGRDAGDRPLQRLLEDGFVHRFGKRDGHPVQRGILLRLTGGIYEGGVVEPQQILGNHFFFRIGPMQNYGGLARPAKKLHREGRNVTKTVLWRGFRAD